MEEDTEILEYSGNAFVNSIFEARLDESEFEKHPQFATDEEEASNHRAKFVKYKYKRRKFIDEVVYYKKMLELLLGKRDEEEEEEAEEERSTSSVQEKRRSFRRVRSVPQCGSGCNDTKLPPPSSKPRIARSASSPNMTPSVDHKDYEVDRPQNGGPPTLRRKSTKSCLLHRLRGRGRTRTSSPKRKSLAVVKSPKMDMRNRRLSAIACMCVELPNAVPDNKRKQSFSHAA